MKNWVVTNGLLITLAVALVGCSGSQFVPAEEVTPPTQQPFIGANIIYIRTTDSPDDAREKMARVVQTEGMGVVAQESGPRMVSTGVGTFAGDIQGSARYFFEVGQAEESDSTEIRAYGRVITSNVSDWNRFQQFDTVRLEAGGNRRSIMWNAFRQLMTMADIYSGGTIYYDRVD